MKRVARAALDAATGLSDKVSDSLGINQSTLSGAIDVVVVPQPDGTLRSTPFHVRFGKLQLLNPQEKVVTITINDAPAAFAMKLGYSGEAYFVEEAFEPVADGALATERPRAASATADSEFSLDGGVPPLMTDLSTSSAPDLSLSRAASPPGSLLETSDDLLSPPLSPLRGPARRKQASAQAAYDWGWGGFPERSRSARPSPAEAGPASASPETVLAQGGDTASSPGSSVVHARSSPGSSPFLRPLDTVAEASLAGAAESDFPPERGGGASMPLAAHVATPPLPASLITPATAEAEADGAGRRYILGILPWRGGGSGRRRVPTEASGAAGGEASAPAAAEEKEEEKERLLLAAPDEAPHRDSADSSTAPLAPRLCWHATGPSSVRLALDFSSGVSPPPSAPPASHVAELGATAAQARLCWEVAGPSRVHLRIETAVAAAVATAAGGVGGAAAVGGGEHAIRHRGASTPPTTPAGASVAISKLEVAQPTVQSSAEAEAPWAAAAGFALSMCGHLLPQPPSSGTAAKEWPPPAATAAELRAFEAGRLSRRGFELEPDLLYHPQARVHVCVCACACVHGCTCACAQHVHSPTSSALRSCACASSCPSRRRRRPQSRLPHPSCVSPRSAALRGPLVCRSAACCCSIGPPPRHSWPVRRCPCRHGPRTPAAPPPAARRPLARSSGAARCPPRLTPCSPAARSLLGLRGASSCAATAAAAKPRARGAGRPPGVGRRRGRRQRGRAEASEAAGRGQSQGAQLTLVVPVGRLVGRGDGQGAPGRWWRGEGGGGR